MKRSVVTRAVSVILVLIVALSSVFAASAAEIEKVTKTYDIAVAFDNSGSMYMSGRTRWSQAKYAMEIFASMLDYDNGDKLTIYTMWPVSVTGKSGSTSYKVEVSSKEDIDKISRMYTMYDKVGGDYNNGTPYAPVDEAYKALSANTKADEKWLVVLTDGEFNSETRKDNKFNDANPLQDRFVGYTNNGINVQFLGLALNKSEIPESQKVKASGNFYVAEADASSTARNNIKDVLIEICNKIFKRNELKDELDGNELELDISMSKLIVFVQGDNDKAPVLKDSSGKAIAAKMDSGLRKHNTISCNQKFASEIKADTSLYGQVVTFENLPKGEYTLEYPGKQDKVKIFYEPDVDISIDFYGKVGDNEDQKITQDTEVLYPGEYRVEYSVIDRITGEDVTKSPLMGENGVTDLKCTVEITNDKKTSEVNVKSGENITLSAGDTVFFNVNGTYLTDYKISTEDNKDGFTFNISKFPAPLELEVEVDVEQSNDWYNLKKSEDWKPIKVYAELDGKKLTDEQMAMVTPTFTFSPEVPYTYEIIPGESAYAVYIGKDADGKSADIVLPEGAYKDSFEITASLIYTDEFGQKGEPAEDDNGFTISLYDLIWEWLKWLIIIVAATAFVSWLLLHKTFPKYVFWESKKVPNEISLKSAKEVPLSSGVYPNDLVCSARRRTAFYVRKTKKAKFTAYNIRPGSNVKRFKIGNFEYKRDASGAFVDSVGKTLSAKKSFSIGNGTEITWYTKAGVKRTGKIKTTK